MKLSTRKAIQFSLLVAGMFLIVALAHAQRSMFTGDEVVGDLRYCYYSDDSVTIVRAAAMCPLHLGEAFDDDDEEDDR